MSRYVKRDNYVVVKGPNAVPSYVYYYGKYGYSVSLFPRMLYSAKRAKYIASQLNKLFKTKRGNLTAEVVSK